MAYLTRRSMLRGSLTLAAANAVGFPHVAKAAATTASMWFAQGFVQDEDVALRKAVADYEKQSGNKIELSIIPFAPERQKIISAITSGVVPDIIDSNPGEILQLYGWQDKWVDVSDVVDTQRQTDAEHGRHHKHGDEDLGQDFHRSARAVQPAKLVRSLGVRPLALQ